MGLSEALHGDVRIEGGSVQQQNFDVYRALNLAEMPRVDVRWIESAPRSAERAKAGVASIAPALANAIFAATGHPVRKLPIRLA